jgi:hypothetical protein
MFATKDEGDSPGQRQGSIRSQVDRDHAIDDSSSNEGTSDSIREADYNGLDRFSTRQSMGPEVAMEPEDSVIEIPDEVYDRIPRHRKNVIVFLLSFCSFLAPISSTSVLAASPQVAAEFGTTGAIINLSNAMCKQFEELLIAL